MKTSAIPLALVQDEAKPLLDHLEELRRRLMVVLAVFAAFSLAAYCGVDEVIHHLAKTTGGFVFTHPAEAFTVRVKIALLGGLFLTVPVFLYEGWRFIGVALAPASRGRLLAILPLSFMLFCAGAAGAWFLILPAGLRFFMGYATRDLQAFLSLDTFIGFAAWLMLTLGIVFQWPLAALILARVGVIGPRTLSAYRRHALIGLAIFSAMITPGPDPVSQLLVLLPIYGLYEVSVWLSRWAARK